MTDEEKKKFLKKMGYSGSCLHQEKPIIEKQPQALEDTGKTFPKKRMGLAFKNIDTKQRVNG